MVWRCGLAAGVICVFVACYIVIITSFLTFHFKAIIELVHLFVKVHVQYLRVVNM